MRSRAHGCDHSCAATVCATSSIAITTIISAANRFMTHLTPVWTELLRRSTGPLVTELFRCETPLSAGSSGFFRGLGANDG